MDRRISVAVVLFSSITWACSSSSTSPAGGNDAGSKDTGAPDTSSPDAHTDGGGTGDTGTTDASRMDVQPASDAGAADTGAQEDTGAHDSGAHDDGQVHDDASSDAHADGSYPTCPMTWLDDPALPQVDGGAALSVSALDGGSALKVLLHGQVKAVDAGGLGGTQGYMCVGADAGGGADSYSWQKTGPEAKLDDCNGTFLIEHTPSEAGASRPQWASQLDTSIVVGETIHSVTVSASAVPWLLLGKASSSGTGLLDQVLYVQRFNTNGGVPTPSACNASTVGTTVEVPYTADYYFYGP